MGRKCYVPGCRSGYRKDNISMFRVPKHKVDEWQKIVNREDLPLSYRAYICEKHFSKRFILRKITNDMYTYPLRHPRLTGDAFPTMLPSDHHNSGVVECGDTGSENGNNTPCIKEVNSNVAPTSNLFLDVGVKTKCDSDKTTDPLSVVTVFNQLWDQSVAIRLPTKSWALHCVPGDNFRLISISEMILVDDDEKDTITRKKLILGEDSFHTYVFGHLVKDYSFLKNHYFYSTSKLEEVVNEIEKLQVCGGLNTEGDHPDLSQRCFYRDATANVWRHVSCLFLISAENREGRCSFCDEYKEVLVIFEPVNNKLSRRRTRYRRNTVNNTKGRQGQKVVR